MPDWSSIADHTTETRTLVDDRLATPATRIDAIGAVTSGMTLTKTAACVSLPFPSPTTYSKTSGPVYEPVGSYVRALPSVLITTTPCWPDDEARIVSVSPVSGRAVSLARTSIGTGPAFWPISIGVGTPSSLAVGASLVGMTLTATVAVACSPWPSSIVYVKLSLPKKSAAGV